VSKVAIFPHLILGSGLSSGDGSPSNKSGGGGDIILILLARALIMFLKVSSSS
jgi:hypothetical protein